MRLLGIDRTFNITAHVSYLHTSIPSYLYTMRLNNDISYLDCGWCEEGGEAGAQPDVADTEVELSEGEG